MKRLIVVAALMFAACGSQKAVENPLPPGYVTLATFTGEVDSDAGTIKIWADPPPASTAGFRTGLTLPETVATVSIATTTPATTIDGTAPCPVGTANVLSAGVTITLGYPTPQFAGALYAEIQTLSVTGEEGCNSSTAPSGLSSTLGLWSFGTVNQTTKTSATTWRFKKITGQKSTFSGRIVGVVGSKSATIPQPMPSSSGTSGIAATRNGLVYSAQSSANLVFLSLDGSTYTLSNALPAVGNAVATYVGATAADDLTWFTTQPAVAGDTGTLSHAYVGVVKSDGTVIAVDGWSSQTAPGLYFIVVDPTNPRKAWFIIAQYLYIRSVTFDGNSTLTLGQTNLAGGLIPVAAAPNGLVFGPSPNNYLFTSRQSGTAANTIYRYNVTIDPYTNVTPNITTTVACNGPKAMILDPDNVHIWFVHYGVSGGYCVMNLDGTGMTEVLGSMPNPVSLTVGKSVTGVVQTNAVWGLDVNAKSVTELIPGQSAFFSVALPVGTGAVKDIAATPAVVGPPAYSATVWVPTNNFSPYPAYWFTP